MLTNKKKQKAICCFTCHPACLRDIFCMCVIYLSPTWYGFLVTSSGTQFVASANAHDWIREWKPSNYYLRKSKNIACLPSGETYARSIKLWAANGFLLFLVCKHRPNMNFTWDANERATNLIRRTDWIESFIHLHHVSFVFATSYLYRSYSSTSTILKDTLCKLVPELSLSNHEWRGI